jgi:hypothetical protein
VRGLRWNWPAIARLHPDGTLDTSFGHPDPDEPDHPADPGFTGLWRVPDVRVFAAGDTMLFCVASTVHRIGIDRSFVEMGLQRIAADGAYDATFGWTAPAVAPPAGRTLTLRAGAGPTEDDAIASVAPAGIAMLGGKYYVVATAFVGGRIYRDAFGFQQTRPTWPVLLVTRWNADGSPDPGFAPQVGGYAPDRRYWAAFGVLAESPSSLLAFGMAAPREERAGSGGPAMVIGQPQPALFRIRDPGGIDFAFGQDGAAITAMQEFGPAVPCAGVPLPDGSVRLAVVDGITWTYGSGNPKSVQRVGSSFGGLAQLR